MPLSQAETHALQSILLREAKAEPVQSVGDGGFAQVAIAALTSLTNILTRVEIILETLGAGACEVPTKADREMGQPHHGHGGLEPEKTADAAERKPRGRPAGKKADAKAEPEKAAAADGDNPFNEPAKPNGAAAPKDNTGFAPGDDAAADPLGDNTADISEPELKALLKEYMGRFGDQGVPKITALLSQFGVKRFQDLPPEKFNAVAAAARKEM